MSAEVSTFPRFSEFRRLLRKGNLVPVYREILADTETPVSAFMKLNSDTNCFLLESVEGGEQWARYSIIGLNPSAVITTRGTTFTVTRGRRRETRTVEDPLTALRAEMQRYQPVAVEGLPRFSGGAVGYMAYDVVKFFERLPDTTRDDLGWPDSCFMITDVVVIFDNLHHNAKVVCNVHCDDAAEARACYDRAVATIDQVIARLHKPLRRRPASGATKPVRVRSNMSRDAFCAMVRKAKEYIRAGEIIQVVLSQRFKTELQGDPFELYRSLRVINPSPYMYYIKMDDCVIVGTSPEVLVRLEHDEVVVRPIAGTRPRGATPEEDMRLEQELLADPKERAEHVMLVDLGRNDVGRIARTGSVHVDDFMVIERYSHVMHLVSNVRGTLRPDCDAYDVFRAAFPAGTVSGAPKIRAMEIIDELEQHRRGPYAGAVGYFSFTGNMDFCITIRTMFIREGKVYVQAGAGIVLDSEPEGEYTETVNKAGAMVSAVKKAYRGFASCS